MSIETDNILGSVDEVVEALGGTAATARLLESSQSRVSNWRSMGRFPDSASVLIKIRDACGQIGKTVDETLFGDRAA